MGWLSDLLNILFPQVCEVCGATLVEGERVVCLQCLARMPRLYFHRQPEHPFVRRMAAAKVKSVASMFAYVKNDSYARMIQTAKYNNRPDIAYNLASAFASELKNEGFFSGIDAILPVPMYAWKQVRRGFNQADEIARGISDITGIPVWNNLVAMRPHQSQTTRNAVERAANAAGIYAVVEADRLNGRHVLIVDDVITTGSTILGCCDAVMKASTAEVSVLSLAATRTD